MVMEDGKREGGVLMTGMEECKVISGMTGRMYGHNGYGNVYMQELVICMVWNGSGHEDMREMGVMMKMSGQAISRDEES